MRPLTQRLGAPEWLITIGAGYFIFALAVAAAFEADLRWLHTFQAAIYVTTIVLSRRRNRWGWFIGISAAALWNYLIMFASPIVRMLIDQLSHGPLRPDILLQGLAWFANLAIIAGGLWAYYRQPGRSRADLARFAVAFVLTTAFLIVAVAIFTPRRLDLLAQGLHPHWP